jgi:hypothetical protein
MLGLTLQFTSCSCAPRLRHQLVLTEALCCGCMCLPPSSHCFLQAVTPMWEELSKWIETHDEAKKSLGGWCCVGVIANTSNLLWGEWLRHGLPPAFVVACKMSRAFPWMSPTACHATHQAPVLHMRLPCQVGCVRCTPGTLVWLLLGPTSGTRAQG